MKFSNYGIALLVLCFCKGQDIVYPMDSLDEVNIYGQSIFPKDKQFLEKAGSNLFIDTQELKQFEYTNVNRLLEGQSGVHLYEEDGYGLRPNISIRGSLAERSSRINLMEDGILVAPAPYASSSAYYFPNIARMKGLEILKGSGQIKYGPNTVGGSLNLLSAPLSKRLKANADLSIGRYNTKESLLYLGNRTGKFYYMVQYLHYDSDGFKKLPSGHKTGFNRNDVVGKLAFKDQIASMPFVMQLKYQYSNENSDETYLGVTQQDFYTAPFERYVGSDLDHMKNNHHQWILNSQLDINSHWNVSVDLYQNRFKRNWFKTQSVDAGEGIVSLGNIYDHPEEYVNELDVLKGSFMGTNSLYLRNNNRSYLSQGVQGNVHFKKQSTKMHHEIYAGMRYHYDDADRFQWDDTYTLDGRTLALLDAGIPGTQSNLVDFAKAYSMYGQYQLQVGKWDMTFGLRYEDIHLQRDNFGEDLDRKTVPKSVRENKNNVWIPGVSVLYKLHSSWSSFVGMHKGFSPAGNTANQSPEESWNYELGLRHQKNQFYGEMSFFITDYENLLGSDLNATGGEGNNELYNAGSVLIQGLEMQLNYEWKTQNGFKFPLMFTYTYQNSSFKKDYDSEIYGEVMKGDHLPYIPENQLRAQLGIEKSRWSLFISYRFMGDRRTQVGQGNEDSRYVLKSYGLMDASLQYQWSRYWRIYVNADNIFNKTYGVARAPYGLRPGMPFFIRGGFEWSL